MRKRSSRFPATLSLCVLSTLAPLQAWAATNQFRGVNWADPGDNFQSGIIYISGLSSSDTYSSALATGNSVMAQFVSKLGANAVRMPINEATVSSYWGTYTGAIDAALSKGSVVLCYWDSDKSNKPADMNAFWSMWKTVVDKYGSDGNTYFEIFNEPNMYSQSDLVSLYSSWLTQFSTVPKERVILDGTGDAQNVPDIGSVSSLDGCLLAVHDYSFFGSDSWTSDSQWVRSISGRSRQPVLRPHRVYERRVARTHLSPFRARQMVRPMLLQERFLPIKRVLSPSQSFLGFRSPRPRDFPARAFMKCALTVNGQATVSMHD